MSDKEFERFLNGDDDHDQGPLECQKRLMFDMVKQKLDNSTDLIGIYSELHIKFPESGYKEILDDLKKISDHSFDQLDYIMSIVLDEMDTGKGPDDVE